MSICYCYWSLLYSAVLCCWADSMRSSRMWFRTSDWDRFIERFEYSSKWCTCRSVWLLHGWWNVKLLPSRRPFCVHHTTKVCTKFSLVLKWQSLWQTTQMTSVVSFITAHDAYASTNETQIVWIETELFSSPRRTYLILTCVLGRHVASTVFLIPKPFGGRRQRRRTVARKCKVHLRSLEEGAGKRCYDCAPAFFPFCSFCFQKARR